MFGGAKKAAPKKAAKKVVKKVVKARRHSLEPAHGRRGCQLCTPPSQKPVKKVVKKVVKKGAAVRAHAHTLFDPPR